VAAERDGDVLVLRVADNGEGLTNSLQKPLHRGMGLAITRRRLETLYGSRQSLALRNLPGGGVEARITLPFRLGPELSPNKEEDHVEPQSVDR
jgi:two-component system LytT family sensor kinase